jgi:hypothetical protein
MFPYPEYTWSVSRQSFSVATLGNNPTSFILERGAGAALDLH